MNEKKSVVPLKLPLSNRFQGGGLCQRAWYLSIRINLAPLQWLRCCVTNLKVAGSIPGGVIGIFHLRNPSDRTMALGSTQPLTEMSTRRISWG